MASEAQSEGSGLVFHPMDQFEVKPLFGGSELYWYSISNVTLWMALTVFAVLAIMVFGTSQRGLVPSRRQSIGELAYGFVYKMVEDVAGKDAVGYFPYIMTLFMFIVCANFLGLLPMSFTTTSHIAVTAVMAMAVFLAVTILGFVKNGMSFLSLFWISSAPLVLRPILALIEVISYFVRPVSHSIRLAGNMMAGHAVIKVFAAFAGIAAIAPFSVLAITAIYALGESHGRRYRTNGCLYWGRTCLYRHGRSRSRRGPCGWKLFVRCVKKSICCCGPNRNNVYRYSVRRSIGHLFVPRCFAVDVCRLKHLKQWPE